MVKQILAILIILTAASPKGCDISELLRGVDGRNKPVHVVEGQYGPSPISKSTKRKLQKKLNELIDKAPSNYKEMIDKFLGDEDAFLRMVYAEMIAGGKVDVDLAVTALMLGLCDDNDLVRKSSADALGKLGGYAKPALPLLKEIALHDEVEYLPKAADDAIANIEKGEYPERPWCWVSPDYPPPMRYEKSDIEDQFEPLIESGLVEVISPHAGSLGIDPDAVIVEPELLSRLGCPNATERKAMGAKLASIDIDVADGLSAIINALGDNDKLVSYRASQVLSGMGGGIVGQLIEALSNDNETLRQNAARLLGYIGRDAVWPLMNLLKEESPTNRAAAALALGEIGPAAKDAVPALIDTLGDSEKNVRAEAIKALGHIGPGAKYAVAALIEKLDKDESDIRPLAASALAAIGPDAKDAVNTLKKEVSYGGSETRVNSVKALYFIDPDAMDCVDFLAEEFTGAFQLTRNLNAAYALRDIGPDAAGAVPVLAKGLKAGMYEARWAAADALEGIGRRAGKAVPNLIESLSDKDYWMRKKAAWALGNIGPKAKDALPALNEMFQSENRMEVRIAAAYAIAKISGDKGAAISFLVDSLNDEDWLIRTYAAEALGEIGANAAAGLAELRELAAGDPFDEIRDTAREAIKNIEAPPMED